MSSTTFNPIPYKAGAPMGVRSLGLILRDEWDREDRHRERRIEKQRKAGFKEPKGLDGQPLIPLGPYPHHDELDDVLFECRALAMKDVRTYHARRGLIQREAEAFDAKAGSADDVAEMERISAKSDELRRDLLGKALVSFGGTPITSPEEIEDIENAGFADLLLQAIFHLQDLKGDARKNCGASPSQTSGNSTATPVHDTTASSAAAPGPSPASPTTPAPSTSTESALGESPSTTPGSGLPSRSPGSSAPMTPSG